MNTFYFDVWELDGDQKTKENVALLNAVKINFLSFFGDACTEST